MEPDISESVHEKVAKLACHHFQKLPKKGKPLPNQWTTLAAIVLENQNTNELKVVSCATGTRCIGKKELSPLGDVVSDSHAEVLTRRSFLVFLYNEIQFASNGASAVLVKKESGLFELLDGVKIHLFVSQLPCGDSAVVIDSSATVHNNPIPPSNEEEDATTPKRPRLDFMTIRTGAKLQSGPLVFEEVQSVGKVRVKPGKGDPTLCMSCSDKIAKWQLLGLQGSLLGNLIPKPIRFDTVTVGCSVPFDKESLERAIFKRFEVQVHELATSSNESLSWTKLLCGHFLPVVGQASMNFSNCFDPSDKDTRNPCPSSVVWNASETFDKVQVIVNGRKQGAIRKYYGSPATMVSVCRNQLFSLFRKVCIVKSICDNANLTYLTAKNMNKDFVEAWSVIKASVMTGWTEKPTGLQDFSVLDRTLPGNRTSAKNVNASNVHV